MPAMKALLLKMKKYIEDTEETIDAEWNIGRSLKEIINDGDMPSLYNELIKFMRKHG